MDNFVTKTTIPGVLILERPVLGDSRGFFHEVENRAEDLDAALARHVPHAQWNHARSSRGVLRGIHVAPWSKLIYVVRGNAQAVIVDLRPDSPTFGKHVSVTVGDRRRAAVFVPAGCGNSYLVKSALADYLYSVSEPYRPGAEFGVAWNDPDLNISWDLRGEPVLSAKDQTNPSVREVFPQMFTTE